MAHPQSVSGALQPTKPDEVQSKKSSIVEEKKKETSEEVEESPS
jgi:hypothetical protein